MKSRSIFNRLWFRLFLRVGIIFFSFVLVIMIFNTAFLSSYYIFKQERTIISQKSSFNDLNMSDSDAVLEYISNIESNYNIQTEIYDSQGFVLYTTDGGQMLDYLFKSGEKLDMQHGNLEAKESKTLSDGSVLERAVDRMTKDEFIVYKIVYDDYTVEMRTKISLLNESADIANNFISGLALVSFMVATIIMIFASRNMTKPITAMNNITKKMASLDFSERLSTSDNDEIGELAESINDMSDKLDNALKDLREKNRILECELEKERSLDVMRREFVANVSHELKTPISIVKGYAEALKENINSKNKDKYCDIIIDESARMNKLVLSILNLSKYESGGIPLNKKNFELDKLIISIAEPILKDSKHEYNLKELSVSADPDLVEQAVKGYLENAVAHNKGEIKVSLKVCDNKARVEVYNDGEQIDPKVMPHIWQSFYRGDISHKRDESRFGLGLSIVKAIAKLHSNSCGVVNNENGVTFWIDFDLINTERSDLDEENL